MEPVFVTVIVCAGMLCALDRRPLALSLAVILAAFAAVRLLTGRASLSVVHIPLVLLPIFYLLSAIAVGGFTSYTIGQVVFMCVPLLISLCVPTSRSVLPVIAVGVFFLAVMSILGAVIPFIPNTFTPAGFNSDSRARLQTLLNYANTGGIMFGCGIFTLLGIQTNRNSRTIIKYFGIAFLSICLMLTSSRFAIIQTIVLLVAYFIIKYRAKKTAVFVSVAFVSAILFGIIFKSEVLINSTMALRLIYWSDAFKAFIGNPVFGLGAEGFVFKVYESQSAIYEVKYVHSAFLQAAVDAGLPALLSLCAAFVMPLKRTWLNDKTVFFVLLLLLAHSVVDVDLSYFPALALLGLCCAVYPPKLKCNTKSKSAVLAVLLLIITTSAYLSVGEGLLAKGLKADREGRFADAEMAYKSALVIMPGDFRASAKLAQIYIFQQKQDEAIEFLNATNPENFNKAIRSELLITAYKNLAYYPEWNDETLALLKYAPFKRSFYAERAEYLLAAYYSRLLTKKEYEAEYAALQTKLEETNQAMNRFSRYLLERDRVLVLNQQTIQ